MYEGFAQLHPIDVEHARMEQPVYKMPDIIPFYNGLAVFQGWGAPLLWAAEYTTWRDEAIAAQETCAISSNINPAPTARISGPGAADFLKFATVNNIDKFPIGSSKHGIICAENGKMLCNGVLMRLDEDVYEGQWLSPVIDMLFDPEKWDCTLEDRSGQTIIFQLIGPKSLEIVEEACMQDFHELKMCRFVDAEILGHKVRVLRFGMSGGLAYEVQCDAESSKEVHRHLIEVGNPYGIRLMGTTAYQTNHTLGGSVMMSYHYLMENGAINDIGEKNKSVADTGENAQEVVADPTNAIVFSLRGSAANRYDLCTMNPFEIGLGNVVNFDHDFIGREALLAYRDNQVRTGVTLKWDVDDIMDVYRSQFEPGESYRAFDGPKSHMNVVNHAIENTFDLVENENGEIIGVSGGRTEAAWHKAMVSMASIETGYASVGSHVYIVWGDEGTRQKRIRAEVVPTPFNTNYSNRTFDVAQIPTLADKGLK